MTANSTIMSEQDYLKDRLDDQITWHDKKSMRNKTCFHRFQMIQIVLAALIPILATVPDVPPPMLRVLIAGLGAAIVIITGSQSLYRFQDLWIEYRTTAETLKNERILYYTGTGPYTGGNPFPLLVERVEALLSQQHSRWLGRVQSIEQQEQTGKPEETAG